MLSCKYFSISKPRLKENAALKRIIAKESDSAVTSVFFFVLLKFAAAIEKGVTFLVRLRFLCTDTSAVYHSLDRRYAAYRFTRL